MSDTVLLCVGICLAWIIVPALYNVYLHPLRKHPGPWFYRASVIPKNVQLLLGTWGRSAVQMHIKYGEVIRIGPNELSYIKPQIWKEVFGRPGKREMPKDSRFFGNPDHGSWNVVTAPVEDHTRMRRLFSHAFSNTALRAQEPLLIRHADAMVAAMGSQAAGGGPVDVVDMFNFATFDIMGELAFGEPLGLLQRVDYIPWVRVIFKGLKFVVFRAVLLEVPIVGPLLQWLTASEFRRRNEEHHQFAADLVERRLAWTEDRKPDIWSFVLRHNDEKDADGRMKGLSRAEMHNNASVFMVAGTETTATNVSGVVYFLTRNPHVYARLIEEVRTTFASSDDIRLTPLSEMVYLNAVLKEGLRIYVPGGEGLTRTVPHEGAEICGEYIAGGTRVCMNHYAAYLHPVNFRRPNEFIPERWIDGENSEFADDKREVHSPFSYGPRDCLGKNLAWLELRLLLAKTLWHYDIELCPESEAWLDQKSYLVWEKGPLMCRLTPVKR